MRRASCSHEQYELTKQSSSPSVLDETKESPRSDMGKYRPCLMLLVMTLIFTMIMVDTCLPQMGYLMKMFILLCKWFQEHLIEGTFIILLMYLIQTMIAFPGTLLNNLTGYIYVTTLGLKKGLVVAFLVSFISLSLSNNVAFLFSKRCCRHDLLDYLKQRSKYTNAIVIAMKCNPIKFGLLLRLCPILFYSHLNYLFGGLEIPFKIFNLLHVGMIPIVCSHILVGGYFGALIFNPGQDSSLERVVRSNQIVAVMIITIVTLAAFLAGLTLKTKKMLRKLEASTVAAPSSLDFSEEKDDVEAQSVMAPNSSC